MTATASVSWWQYSAWVKNIARNSRITGPITTLAIAELAVIRTFLKVIWNPTTQTGTRSWLDPKFRALAVTGEYTGDIDTEPSWILIKMLNIVGRDLKKTPPTDAEVTAINTLMAGVYPCRRYGTGELYGGTPGSTVSIP
jgi:hypothetical protein